jgi:hypothetical protein
MAVGKISSDRELLNWNLRDEIDARFRTDREVEFAKFVVLDH